MNVAFDLTFAVKNAFFDKPKIEAKLKKAKRQQLSRAGAFVRKKARQSLLRRKSISSPGSPPHTHSKGLSLKTILFYYDARRDSVIVGPVKLNSKISAVRPDITLPALMEFGGSATISEFRYVVESDGWSSEWRKIDLRRKPRSHSRRLKIETRNRKANYPSRPFMHPALLAEAPKFPDLFAHCIKG
jgi:hypothetical protein